MIYCVVSKIYRKFTKIYHEIINLNCKEYGSRARQKNLQKLNISGSYIVS